ncbi:hypothetical protein Pla123a_40990 [Posidoniimonas polymericola]|uniref:Outer membrane efflux protein n=1 Tax=Posidoniimonas polymericola TaxID=2528002 RepID=A0A5C5YBN3_9BACT|nr:hypothetical protein [Posidoniimonas polymericola]TWT72800.1 hypothetical protein Pla123a_40990 [Posidoniimonas polymericola]
MTALPRRSPNRLAVLLTAALAWSAVGQSAQAETAYDTQRRIEIAALRLQLYENVEYPAELRRLKSELKLAEAEAASLERLLREYEPFDKFSTGRPLVLTIESTRLALLRAGLRRDNLRQDLMAQQRSHYDRLRLLHLELEQARAGL